MGYPVNEDNKLSQAGRSWQFGAVRRVPFQFEALRDSVDTLKTFFSPQQ